MEIIWTREALNRLIEIENYISNDSPDRAAQFVNYLIDQEQSLMEHPKRGRIVPEIGNEDIGELIVRKYRLIYRLLENRVEILSVFEGHRLLRLEELDIK